MDRERKNGGRSCRGAATLILVPITAVFVVLALGIYGFELARASLAREQLRACCDAAALTAAATLDRAGELKTPEQVEAVHKQAISQALEVFRRNYVAGTPLADADLVPQIIPAQPKAGKVNLDIDWLDFKGRPVADLKDPMGKRALVRAKAGLNPGFGSIFGLGPVEIAAAAQAGKQRPLDLVLAVDISASMCSESYLKMVRRYLDGAGGQGSENPLHHVYDIYGEGLNPRGLRCAPLAAAPQGMGTFVNPGFNAALRSCTQTGSDQYLAGNINVNGPIPEEASATTAPTNCYTDVVVDLPGAPFYSNTPVIVEAARGNLDNMENYTRSLCQASGIPASLVGVATKAEYERQVRDRNTLDRLGRAGTQQPYHSVLNVLADFCREVSAKEDCHFSLIPFATIAGNGKGTLDKVKDRIHAESFPIEGGPDALTDEFDNTSVVLDQTDDNLTRVMTVLASLKPQWGTNTADCFVQVNEMLWNQGGRRGKAQPVVLLLTDGLPAQTLPHVAALNPNHAGRFHGPAPQVLADTLTEARRMGDRGARVYTIGFLHNSDPQQVQRGTAVLSQIADEAGHGSKFFLAEDVNQLKDALLAIQNDLNQVTLEEEVAFEIVSR